MADSLTRHDLRDRMPYTPRRERDSFPNGPNPNRVRSGKRNRAPKYPSGWRRVRQRQHQTLDYFMGLHASMTPRGGKPASRRHANKCVRRVLLCGLGITPNEATLRTFKKALKKFPKRYLRQVGETEAHKRTCNGYMLAACSVFQARNVDYYMERGLRVHPNYRHGFSPLYLTTMPPPDHGTEFIITYLQEIRPNLPKLREENPPAFLAAEIIAHAGLRCGEVVEMREDDLLTFELNRKHFYLVAVRAEVSKTRRARKIPISKYLWDLIDELRCKSGDGYIFPSIGTHRRNQAIVDLNTWIKQFWDVPGFKAYYLRKVFISYSVLANGIEVTAKMAGNSSEIASDRYLHLIPTAEPVSFG